MIAQVVVYPTTIRSRPQRPQYVDSSLHSLLEIFSLQAIYGSTKK